MNQNSSTHPESRNLPPAGNAFLAALFAPPAAPSDPAAEHKRRVAEVVARFRALRVGWLDFDPNRDEGDFVTWESTEKAEGFCKYDGQAWARQTEVGFRRAQITHVGDAFADDERAILLATFTGEAWQPPASRHWVVFEDTEARAPLTLPDYENDAERWTQAANAFAASYRAELPKQMRELGMVIGLSPGAPVYVAAWLGKQLTPRQIDSWLRYVDPREEDNRRFRAVDGPPRHAFLDSVALEPAHIAAASFDALRAPAHPAGAVIPTGTPLDQLIRLGGTSAGGLVVLLAGDKNCKTLTLGQIAEHRTALDRKGLWYAIDENAASIQKRRWQYRGDVEDVARQRAERETVQDGLTIVDASQATLDRVIEVVANVVRSGQDVDFYLDSLNSASLGQVDLEDIVRRLKATGAHVFATAAAANGKDGRMHVRGSTLVRFEADVTLELDFDAKQQALALSVRQSRTANDGTVTAMVDTAGQRFVVGGAAARVSPVPPPPVSEADANRRERILAALDKGPKTARALRTWVAGHNTQIAAELAALVAAGKVVLNGKEYALKDPA